MALLSKRLSAIVVALGALTTAHASITWHFVSIIDGDQPDGSEWATLTISDLGIDEVEFTLTHNDTSASPQFISHLWLNMSEIPADLAASFSDPISSIDWGDDAFSNTGNRWDLDVDLFSSQNNRLEVGESVTWTLTGAGLDETDFDVLSSPNGQNIAQLGMIHLQGFNGGGSAKIGVDENFPSVPEPASCAVLALGALAALRRGRKRKLQ